MANRSGNSGNSGWVYFWGAPKSLQIVTAAMKLKGTYSLEGKLCQPESESEVTQSCPTFCDPMDCRLPRSSVHGIFQAIPRQHIKKQRHYFANKGPSSQGYGFSSGHVWMWELDYKESWVPKNWCFWTMVLEKTLESPLDCKEIHPVHPEGDQSWVFTGRTDV